MATRGMTEFRADGVDYTVNDPNIAQEFDASVANAKGVYVYYQGDLYRFNAAYAANTAWGSRSKTKVKLGEELLDEIMNRESADNGKVPNTRTVNGHALSSDVTVTKSDVGLGNVDNTSDANKPISTATQTALNGKVPTTRKVNGHALSSDVTVTKGDVGLGNVDNTADLSKPVSTATQAAIDAAVAAEAAARDAAVDQLGDALVTEAAARATGDANLENSKVPKTTTVNGHALSGNVTVTKADVGLGNVDNTSDLSKPISTATQAALDLKVDKANIENDLTGETAGYVLDARQGKVLDDKVSELKSAFNLLDHEETADTELFESGTIKASDGSNSSSSTRIRTKAVFSKNVHGIKLANGYSALIYAWNGNTYVGNWNGTTFIKSTTGNVWFDGTVLFMDVNPNYTYKIAVQRGDGGNISVSEAVNVTLICFTDKTLTLPDDPADAKSVGDEFNTLKQYAFYGNRVSFDFLTDPDNWVVGSRITDVGANRNDTSACRTNYKLLDTVVRIKLNHSDYIFNVWGYSSSSISSMVAMLKQRYDSNDVLIAPNNGITRYRIAVIKKDGTTFTGDYTDPTSDIYKVLNALETYVGVDDTLTAAGVAADAKVTGDQMNNLNENNSRMIAYDSENVAETTTSSGITYSVTDGLAVFSGESTASTRINRIGDINVIPSWMEENTDYFVELNETGTKNVKVVINAYKSGSLVKTLYSSSSYGSFNTGSYSNVDGIIIRYSIAANEDVDCTIRLRFYNAPGNKYIPFGSQSTQTKVRIMQYNIGKFNMGQNLSGGFRLLNTENLEEYMNNNKRLFGDIQPDIIGFEEYENDMTIPGTGGAEDENISMDTLLFDRLYPYGHDDASLSIISKKAIKAKYKLTSSERKNLHYSYEYDETEYTGNFHVIYATIDIEGKNVACVVNAFPNSQDDYSYERNMLMKKAFYQAAVDVLADEDYAIIICDSNLTAEMAEEVMEDVLVPAGYNSVHGSYFPWQDTWQSFTDPNTRRPLDNIFYKEGKIQLVNFKVLWDERANLCSDHAPVYADLMLM